MPRRRIPMAIVYDFDGTLAPGNVQERQFIPDVGMTPDDFWAGVDRLSEVHQAAVSLMYMYEMLKKADEARVPVRREDFRAGSQDIELFDGVRDWFDRVNKYGRAEGVRLEHYIVSSGNAEIIEGTPIATKFAKIYASRFSLRPKRRGCLAGAWRLTTRPRPSTCSASIRGPTTLATTLPSTATWRKKDRPVPFENMVYIGDGVTDVPCFRLVKDQGGLSIAVYRPHTRNAREKAETFVRDGRVRCAVPANYTEGGELDRLVHDYIKLIAAREPFA